MSLPREISYVAGPCRSLIVGLPTLIANYESVFCGEKSLETVCEAKETSKCQPWFVSSSKIFNDFWWFIHSQSHNAYRSHTILVDEQQNKFTAMTCWGTDEKNRCCLNSNFRSLTHPRQRFSYWNRERSLNCVWSGPARRLLSNRWRFLWKFLLSFFALCSPILVGQKPFAPNIKHFVRDFSKKPITQIDVVEDDKILVSLSGSWILQI